MPEQSERSTDRALVGLPVGRTRRKISHIVAGDLRRQILSGELPVGQHLPAEADLMVALQVSRDTLREALRILETQSLLEIRRGRNGGAVVRHPGLDSVGQYIALLLQVRKVTLAQLEEARSVIEPPAAEQVARRCDDGGLDQLDDLHRLEQAAAESGVLSFTEAVRRFDQRVIELSGNRSLVVIAGVLRQIHAGQVFAAMSDADAVTANRLQRRVVESHRALLDAARRRDPVLAKQAWADYLITTNRLMVSRRHSRQPIDVVPLWRALVAERAETGGRLATAVAIEIRARIAEGRLAEGDRLAPLPDLAKEFDISRPTLREAMRILEMERLLEIRSGDRAGPTVRHPSVQMAVHLAGTVFEAQGVTTADFFEAVQFIEPPVLELAASRIGSRSLAVLHGLDAELREASTGDMPRFARTLGRGLAVAFEGTRNPVFGVIAEMFEWVRTGTERAVADAASPEWVMTAGHISEMFGKLVAALDAGDSPGAKDIWEANLSQIAPYIESSELGLRSIAGIIEG